MLSELTFKVIFKAKRPKIQLRENNQILVFLTELDFALLALKMALKVNSDNIFEDYGLCSLCEHGFISSKALQRLFVTFT